VTKRIGIGGSDFKTLIDKDLLFVDKTLFIKAILNDTNQVTLITRPRRWGKTLNLSMLHYFFSAEVYGQKTQGLFDRLLIAKESENYIQKHQGKYPVIFLSLKDVKEKSFKDAAEKIGLLIRDIYAQHRYVSNNSTFSADDKDLFDEILHQKFSLMGLSQSLRHLSQYLYQHHQKKVYVLIDEYDTPLNFARNQEYFDEMTLFMKNFLGASLKDNPYLEKGVLTGILRISKDSMLSGLNNLQVHTTLRDIVYAPYFGFTDEELDSLFAEQNLSKDEASVKAWYNGYCINGLTLYNPWSIMSCLSNQAELMPYWLDTGSDDLLKELLQHAKPEVKQLFQELVSGNTIDVLVDQTMRFDQVKTDESMLWNLLLSAGYLKVLELMGVHENNAYHCKLAIPNREVLGLYKGIFLQWLMPSDQTFKLKNFTELLATGNADEFAKVIEKFLKIDFFPNPKWRVKVEAKMSEKAECI
jgi:Predicted AAA-ATPase